MSDRLEPGKTERLKILTDKVAGSIPAERAPYFSIICKTHVLRGFCSVGMKIKLRAHMTPEGRIRVHYGELEDIIAKLEDNSRALWQRINPALPSGTSPLRALPSYAAQ